MKLKSLTIKDFKGIREFHMAPEGEDVDLYGDNGTGKTTIADAFQWLLFDKDSQNKKDFAIKTLGPDGEPFHGLDHEVEAVVTEGPREITLKKVYHEVWTKKRGSAKAEFTGHTTDYFMDGVSIKANEYVNRIKLLIEESIFKLLTSPTYFNEQLQWQQRREIILKVCGDITDVDVIASDAALAGLPAILGNHSIDDYKKIIASRRTKINEEIKKIPIRIDEVTRSLPDLDGLDMKSLAVDIDLLQAQIKAKEQELSRIENGHEVTEKATQVREIEGALIALKNGLQHKISGQIDARRTELQQAKGRLFDAQTANKEKRSEYERLEKTLANADSQVVQLRDDWHIENGNEFYFEQAETCPTCGQALPTEKLQAARDKALADFNRKKSERLETINATGKKAAQQAEDCRQQMAVIDAEIKESGVQVATANKEVSGLEVLIENMMHDAEAYKEDPAYTAKLAEKQAIETEIKQLQQDNTAAVAAVKKDIEKLGGELLSLQTMLARFEQYDKGQARIAELEQQERKLAKEYEELEGNLYLTEQFTRTKVNLLEEKINSRFKLARFKLFDVQINGAVNECCETTYGGVPYSSGLNNAARINVGLDIINALSEHYKFTAPIFIDNAEAVTQIIPTQGQQIRLRVSEDDKVLRVETRASDNLFREAV